MTKKVIWYPPAELIENSKLTKFIKYCSVKNYDELEIKSQSDPGWLWENVIKFADINFFKNYKKIKTKRTTSLSRKNKNLERTNFGIRT